MVAFSAFLLLEQWNHVQWEGKVHRAEGAEGAEESGSRGERKGRKGPGASA